MASLKTAREQLKVYRQSLLKNAFEGKLTAAWRAAHHDQLETAATLQQRIARERQTRYQQQFADWQTANQQGPKPKPPKPLPPLTAEELAELPELPAGWCWVRLGATNVEVFDGPFGSNLKSSDYVSDGVRVIRLENIGAMEFIEDKLSFITPEKYQALDKHTVFPGDLVFSSFVTENVRVAMVPPSVERAVNKADCFCIRLFGETLLNSFALSFLATRSVYKRLEEEIHGVGRPRINTTQLKNVVIPVCSTDEQRELVALVQEKLSEADQLDQTLATALQQADALRQSILKKAFHGQLVKQAKNEEPATALLERIRAERLIGMKSGKRSKIG
ncbi:MAG TPA: restriction endonuclease subunit S [Azonexus sp.]|jgi:type I restriction enzyme S subunit|nr:restriction endonuclease subunit S [Azonexus sp.]